MSGGNEEVPCQALDDGKKKREKEGNMKRLFVIIVALFVGFAYATNENVPTSKKFVDDALAQKQPKFDGLGNDKLMLYSNTTDGIVASRDIVTTLGNSTSANTVPTVGAINAGLATKQDTLNGDAGWVAENTGIAGAVVQKPIYSTTNNYGNALVEVETLNNAVINAVNSELTVVPGVGWTINTAANLNLLPVPKTYNPYLPDGYTQVEYLQGNRSGTINTGVIFDSGTLKYSIEVKTESIVNDNEAGVNHESDVIGNFTGSDINSGFCAGVWCNSLTCDDTHSDFFNYVSPMSLRTNGKTNNQWHTMETEFANNTMRFSVDGDTKSIARDVYWNDAPIVLMGGSTTYLRATSKVKIRNIKIWHNGVLVRNYITCRRNSDNVYGVCDSVNKTFTATTKGTPLTGGPDVVD